MSNIQLSPDVLPTLLSLQQVKLCKLQQQVLHDIWNSALQQTALQKLSPNIAKQHSTRKKYSLKLSSLSLKVLNLDWLHFKDALSGLRQFLATESPLKMMKNAFYFIIKALFVLKIFKFLSWLFDHVSKQLGYGHKVNFKFYDVTAWLTMIIYILPNISRCKDNKTREFGQLIECNIRNIFLEKSNTK